MLQNFKLAPDVLFSAVSELLEHLHSDVAENQYLNKIPVFSTATKAS